MSPGLSKIHSLPQKLEWDCENLNTLTKVPNHFTLKETLFPHPNSQAPTQLVPNPYSNLQPKLSPSTLTKSQAQIPGPNLSPCP